MTYAVKSSEYLYIQASAAILVSQFCKSSSTDLDTDPFMILVPPIEQYDNSYTIATVTPTDGGQYQNYINIIVRSSAIPGLLMDGRPLLSSVTWVKLWTTVFSVVALPVSNGSHTMTHTSLIQTFSVISYGHKKYESYGFPGGLRLADIGEFCQETPSLGNDGWDNDCDGRIDEELADNIDNDNDRKVDEDLAEGFYTSQQPTTVTSTTTRQTTSAITNSAVSVRTLDASPSAVVKNGVSAINSMSRGKKYIATVPYHRSNLVPSVSPRSATELYSTENSYGPVTGITDITPTGTTRGKNGPVLDHTLHLIL